MKFIAYYDSPLGKITLAGDEAGLCGLWFEGEKYYAHALTASGADGNEVKATLPSNVFKILIKEGDAVKAGQNVIVLEAMKMEINIESPRDGIIDKILIAQGDTVDADQVLAILR